ncbi:MAG: hypothetical protein U5K51_09775 [Flavobacteriaceae bacterium]|nr:hypothetical protein [Flavobacteriaceae bacterium]
MVIAVWEENKLLLKEKLTLDEDNAFKKLEFQINAETIGNHFYTVKIGSLDREENLVNNNYNFSVRVLEDKASILLLYDHIHPDIGFWQRMAGQDNRRKIEVTHISEFNQQLTGYSFVILMNPNTKFERIMNLMEEKSIPYLGCRQGHNGLDILEPVHSLILESSGYIKQITGPHQTKY